VDTPGARVVARSCRRQEPARPRCAPADGAEHLWADRLAEALVRQRRKGA